MSNNTFLGYALEGEGEEENNGRGGKMEMEG